MTATKISPISIHKLRSSNLWYKTNNKNINQTENYVNNENDTPHKETTNRQHSIQEQKYVPISNSQTNTKNIQSASKTKIPKKYVIDKYNTTTGKKHTDNNINNEHTNLQRYKNNTTILQNSKINTDKDQKLKSSLQNNGKNKKTLFPT